MIKQMITGFVLLIWLSTSMSNQTLRPFQSDSLDEIVNNRKGLPFILVLWSIDCPPCLHELSQLQQLQHQFPKTGLVLVATDDSQYADSVQQVLQDFQLERIENWIFDDSIPERLRAIIDPSWYGELPRAYFYDTAHQRSAHSGSLKKVKLEQWLNKINLKPYSDLNKK